MRWLGAAAAGLTIIAVATTAEAQRADGVRAGVARFVPAPLVPVASLILPGAGQFLQKRDRAVAYAAVETVGWWKLARDISERAKQESEFKFLARTVARARLSPNGPDGNWTYYESMRDYRDSGVFTQNPSSLVPDDDPTTFNGHTWEIALATSGDSVQALTQYAARAYKGNMLWSWSNAGIQYDVFKRATLNRDDANAAVVADATVIALNHLISMVDAFAAFRLDTKRLSDGRTTVGGSLSW